MDSSISAPSKILLFSNVVLEYFHDIRISPTNRGHKALAYVHQPVLDIVLGILILSEIGSDIEPEFGGVRPTRFSIGIGDQRPLDFR